MELTEPIAQGWYIVQKQRDVEAIAKSESIMGREKHLFVDAMALLSRMVNAIFSEGLVQDLVVKVKTAVANHAFDLLWSAWTDALAGRYGAAMHHIRSIDESPDFLAALQVDPSFASKMAKGKGGVKEARAIMKRELEKFMPGLANRLEGARNWRWVHHKFAHVTFPAIAGTLPKVGEGEQATLIVRPGGGAVHEATLRGVAICLAESALDVLRAIAFSLQDVKSVSDLWEREARAFDQDSRLALNKCAQEIGIEVPNDLGVNLAWAEVSLRLTERLQQIEQEVEELHREGINDELQPSI